MSSFIKKKADVNNPDSSKVYSHTEQCKPILFHPESMNIYFVGPRGSGKSTLAKRVSAELENSYIDTDDLITQRCGQTISEIVSEQGWDGFRLTEHQVLQEVSSTSNCTVATGGGAVLLPENRELLKRNGIVFYLIADADILYNRLKDKEQDTTRPSLSSLPLKEELGKTLMQRENLYLEVTHYILQANKDIEKLLTDVLTNL